MLEGPIGRLAASPFGRFGRRAKISLAVAFALVAASCSAAEPGGQDLLDANEVLGDETSGDGAIEAFADVAAEGAADAPTEVAPPDVGDGSVDSPDAVTDAAPSGVAPPGAVPSETKTAGRLSLAAGASLTLRVDAKPSLHYGGRLDFSPDADVVLSVLRWDGEKAVKLGETDGGKGLRTLAVFDGEGERTFWFVVSAGKKSVSGTLAVTETPFADGAKCASDCAKLLQLPLPNDPRVDGYATDGNTVFRYQFGRRDLLMFVRHAGKTLRGLGHTPFIPQDFSQWNGETPGTDTGAPRHASHQRGKDVDISLYGDDGKAPWRSYCTAVSTADGRECRAGSAKGLDAETNARMIADFYGSDRVTMMFLDKELIALVKPAAKTLSAKGAFESRLLPYFSDGRHLQHWPNHDNHVHVRVSEEPVGASAGWVGEPEFEAP